MKIEKSTIILTFLIGLSLCNLCTLSILTPQSNSVKTYTKNIESSASFSVVELWKFNNSVEYGKMSMSADGSYIAFANTTDILCLNKTSNSTLWTYNLGSNTGHIDISADGEYILVGTNSPIIYLFNKSATVPKQPIWTYNIGGAPRAVAKSLNGDYIAVTSGGTNDTLYLFNNSGPSGPQLVWKYNITLGQFSHNGLAISATGEYIAATRIYEILLFNNSYADPKTPVWTFATDNDTGGVDISEDGYYIAAGEGYGDSNTGYIHLFNRTFDASKQPIWSYPTNCEMSSVVISADGNYIAASKITDNSPAINTTLYFLSTTNSKPKATLWEYESERDNPDFRDIAITADGNYVAAGTGGVPTAYIFNSDASASKQPLWNERGNVVDIELSLDGRYMCINRDEFIGNGGEISFYQVTLPSSSSTDDDDDETKDVSIPFGNYYLLFLILGVVALTILKRRKVTY